MVRRKIADRPDLVPQIRFVIISLGREKAS